MLQMGMPFADGMVLQRGKQIPIWGQAEAGASVTVSLAGQLAQTTADEAGAWSLALEPMDEGVNLTMTVTSGASQILLADIAMGDVFFLGGQSNMEFALRYDRDFRQHPEEIEGLSRGRDIRFFDMPELSYPGELLDANYQEHYGFWRKHEREDLQWYSAVGYYFACQLAKEWEQIGQKGVPIGLLACNWGGSDVSCWLSEEILRSEGLDYYFKEYEQATADLDLEKYERDFPKNPLNFRTNIIEGIDAPIQDYIMNGDYDGESFLPGLGRVIAETFPAQEGAEAIQDMSQLSSPVGPKHPWRPAALYEPMLLPLAPYAIKAFLYYQGESDTNTIERAMGYDKALRTLIGEWRRLWGEEIPFYIVQLPGFEQWSLCRSDHWQMVREKQQWVADHVSTTGLISISDDGMRWNIHPVKKRPVGERFAYRIACDLYGAKEEGGSPVLTGLQRNGEELILFFDQSGEGLRVSSESLYGEDLTDAAGQLRLHGFLLQRGEECIASEDCQLRIERDRLILSSPFLGKEGVLRVSLGSDAYYQCNLYNSRGIPPLVGMISESKEK